VVAAEVGHLELAYDYFAEAALLDLGDIHHNTRDGVHLAALASSWLAAVAGFGGMRDHGGKLSFKPQLPRYLDRLTFRLTFRGRRLMVAVEHREAVYTLLEGDELELEHHGEGITVSTGDPVSRPIPSAPRLERPRQPRGREPIRRGS
jgi:alpha,alpha-trehalose phosphorylase